VTTNIPDIAAMALQGITFMTWVLAYLAVGGLALIGILVDAWIRRDPWSFMGRRYNSLPEAVLERVVVPAIAGAAIIVAWPFAIAVAVHFYRRKAKDLTLNSSLDPDTFTVQRDELVDRFTLNAIEAAEIVYDPLQGVPPVPFGHLNRAWLVFKNQLQEEDEIWSFRAERFDIRLDADARQGYASVRKGVVVAVFVARLFKHDFRAGTASE
jgi:hypothetical protein